MSFPLIDGDHPVHPVEIDDYPLLYGKYAAVTGRGFAPGREGDSAVACPFHEFYQLLFVLRLNNGIGNGFADKRPEKAWEDRNVVAIQLSFYPVEGYPAAVTSRQMGPVGLLELRHLITPVWIDSGSV